MKTMYRRTPILRLFLMCEERCWARLELRSCRGNSPGSCRTVPLRRPKLVQD